MIAFLEALLLNQAAIMLEAGLGLLVCSIVFSMLRFKEFGENGSLFFELDIN